jgi:multidrug efflux pump subunit AcrA (membrane-fusion protein)
MSASYTGHKSFISKKGAVIDMKNPTISLCATMVIATLFVFSGCHGDAESKDQAGRPRVAIAPQSTPVEVEEVQLGAISSVVTATGTITARRESRIGPKISGRCERIYVEEGDHIKEGQMLARLDQSSLIIAMNQARAALATAKATLNKVLAGTRQELIQQAEADFSSAKANLEWAQKEFARNEALYRRHVVSQKSLDSIKMQLQVAEAQYKKAKEYLEMAKRGSTPEDIEVARAQVAQAEVALKMAEKNLEDSVIAAPFPGVVLKRLKNEGEYITSTPDTPIIYIADIHKVKVELDIPEDKIQDICLGQRAEIRVDGYPDEVFQGQVSLIRPLINSQTRTFTVKLDVPNPDYRLKPGMYARVKITLMEKKDVPLISRDAVLKKDGMSYVMLVNNSKAREQTIKTGLAQGDRVEVIEGVSAGDQVIVSGHQGLKSGMAVKITGGGN